MILRRLLAQLAFLLAATQFVHADRKIWASELEPHQSSEQGPATSLQEQFQTHVLPFLQKNCLECHGDDEPEAKLDLTSFQSAEAVSQHHALWEILRDRVVAREMPPADSGLSPTEQERQAVIDWINALRRADAEKSSGDPGRLLPRRLSNAEYNYSIRDLTGVDLRPTDTFPVDPANEAGFDNTGEALTVTPALLSKYLDAARSVAEHLVLTPEGINFAEFPVNTDTDRDKYCVRRIVAFYQQQPVDLADYFFACWQFHNRKLSQQSDVTLAELAERLRISEKYLLTVWNLLNDQQDDFGPIERLRSQWRALPSSQSSSIEQVKLACAAMRDNIMMLRGKLRTEFKNLSVPTMHSGSQPLVMWKNEQYAKHRCSLNRAALQVVAVSSASGTQIDSVRANEPEDSPTQADEASNPKDKIAETAIADADLQIPAEEVLQRKHVAAFERFCRVFPDSFFVTERGREYLRRKNNEVEQEQKGRLLSAGFHSMLGYFRDDQPLCELILTDEAKAQLDRLWAELDFITAAPIRQHTGFVWFERTDSQYMLSEEFDFARAEDKEVTSEEKIKRLADVYLAKAIRSGGSGAALQAIEAHFENINSRIRWLESTRAAAESKHLAAVISFANRAYRRPLSEVEQESLRNFYQHLRTAESISHEDAIRDTLVSVLMSPHFWFLLPLPLASEAVIANDKQVPISDESLASRLSYFLWASMPDEELLQLAAEKRLLRPEVLIEQTKRMLQDDRVRGLATEFGANWLDIRRFGEHNSVDRERFPTFDNELRQSMFEEPVRFLQDAFQNNRSILDLIYGKHTFVNAALAKHYGLAFEGGADWLLIEDAGAVGRGGLLPMAVFHTANSPGLRTSPVKRGYWVVRRVLGERIPAPPPNVPELPDNEELLGKLTLREALALHREDKNCSICHDRFDSFGLAFENFGPIGELRSKDLGGRDVDTKAVFPDNSERIGLAGLKAYIHEQREQDFVENLCRKLLAYALGRSLQLSDDALIEDMKQKLVANDFRFAALIEAIVTSPQFTHMRPVEFDDSLANR